MLKINSPCVACPEQEAKGVRIAHALRLLLRACHKAIAKLIRNISDGDALWKSGAAALPADFAFPFGVQARNLV
jgi:hypothetical protein